jgi:hypothetical protein
MLKKEKEFPLDQRMVQKKTTTHTHENLMTDLRLSEPNGYKLFCGWTEHHLMGCLLHLQSLKKLTCEKQSLFIQRLSITLRYLDSGNTFEDLKFILLSPLDFLFWRRVYSSIDRQTDRQTDG